MARMIEGLFVERVNGEPKVFRRKIDLVWEEANVPSFSKGPPEHKRFSLRVPIHTSSISGADMMEERAQQSMGMGQRLLRSIAFITFI